MVEETDLRFCTPKGVEVLNYSISQSVVFRSKRKRERKRIHYRISRFLHVPTRIAINCHTHASWSKLKSLSFVACQPPWHAGYGSEWKEEERGCVCRDGRGGKKTCECRPTFIQMTSNHTHARRVHTYVKKLAYALLLLPSNGTHEFASHFIFENFQSFQIHTLELISIAEL